MVLPLPYSILPIVTDMDTNLTNEELADAIRQRVQEHKYWQQIAASLNVTEKTLWRARQTDRWAKVALEVVEEIKAEAFPVAWQGLLDAAALKDVAACKEILNRVDKVVEQTVNVKHSGGIDLTDEPTRKLVEQLEDRLVESHAGNAGNHAD